HDHAPRRHLAFEAVADAGVDGGIRIQHASHHLKRVADAAVLRVGILGTALHRLPGDVALHQHVAGGGAREAVDHLAAHGAAHVIADKADAKGLKFVALAEPV